MEKRSQQTDSATPGSLFSSTGQLVDAVRDLRASRVDDIVTILVADKASATATGTTNTARKSSASAGIQALGGALKATSAWPNMAAMTGNQQLQGQGVTSRDSTFTTTLSARVTHVLPNGNLVVEGEKLVHVNSEHQEVIVRGIIRPADLTSGNQISSDRLADLEVRINGKGVVNDSVRRPNILYRVLLGLLPF
ncbi:MAG: flagellar basal body L-ring protein FlgH [Acidobacteria bacterium]|nr:flagellar basal body L-ring protein FlgH [Acidobacteriota bacterium]